MTQDKDFKRLVRARAKQTGDRYTTARSALADQRPENDDGPPRSIFGLETRYTAEGIRRHGNPVPPDHIARYIFRRAVSWGRSSNIYLPNGARLYLGDSGEMEYATPECDDAAQVVAHVHAGSELFVELARIAEQRLAAEGFSGHLTLTHALGSPIGESHENYLVRRPIGDDDLGRTLVPFLVTRVIFAGAGTIITEQNRPRFLLSRRAESFWSADGRTGNGGQPPLLDSSSPPLAANGSWRLRVLGADANQCETATFLKVGTTALIVRLIERRPDLARDLALQNPVRSARELNRDLAAPLRLANGRAGRAVDVQRELLASVRSLLRKEGAARSDERVVRLWERSLSLLASRDARLDRMVDWAAKRRLIEATGSLERPEARQLDNGYHVVGPATPLHELAAAGRVDRIATTPEVARARAEPPQTTRARMRGEFIRQAREHRRDYTVDWMHLKINDHAQRTLVLADPAEAHDQQVDSFLEGLARGPGDGPGDPVAPWFSGRS